MKALSRQLAYYEEKKEISGIKIARAAPRINHLLFADDFLLFCKANIDQTRKLLQVIDEFISCSGQVINF